MPSYARLPVAFVRGEGAWLIDAQGQRYLDALSGVAVCSLGHAHPAITDAICDQARQLLHTSNIYQISLQAELAERLTALSGMDNAFFCNSGAEANEAGIKITRLYARAHGIAKPKVVVMEGSFHGRTMATLSATGNNKIQAGFEPLVEGFLRIPYNDITALQELKTDPDIVAVLLEPIQGEGGVNVPAPGYLTALRELCDRQQWLLLLDEVQTGMGRTGRWFACQHEAVVPDIMMLAKSLGNGVPIGACLARGQAAELIQPGKHGSTFGGNLLACRTALAVIDTIEQHHLVEHAAILGEHLLQGFRRVLTDLPGINAIRGRGMMLGIELNRPCGSLVQDALTAGVLINVTAERTVRLLPPLIMTDEEGELLIERVSKVITSFLQTA